MRKLENVYVELEKAGSSSRYKQGLGWVHSVSMDSLGIWFVPRSLGYNPQDSRILLDLKNNPALKDLLSIVEQKLISLKCSGGRVFIGSKGVLTFVDGDLVQLLR